MDFESLRPTTDEAATTIGMLRGIRHLLWRHQQRLRANPDPTDDWWFLVDLDAPEPNVSPDWKP